MSYINIFSVIAQLKKKNIFMRNIRLNFFQMLKNIEHQASKYLRSLGV